jgi:membrane-associated phospholipid phosphatase
VQTTHSTTVSPVDNKQVDKMHSGLRSPGWFGKHPIVGLIMVLLGGGLFGALAIAVQSRNPQLLAVDTRIVNDLHRLALHSTPFFLGLMIFGFYAGEEIIVAIGVILVVYFLYKRYWTEMWMVLIAWVGEAVLWLLLANYFSRSRPVFPVAAWHQMTAPSFPSGHVFGAVLCYGLLAYFIVPKMPTRFWKAVVVAAAALIILYVGYARLFVGDHYPSDILAGYGAGIAWGGLVYTVVEYIARRKRRHKEIKRQSADFDH